jgi:hypothetical protein
VPLNDPSWQQKHWETIRQTYRRKPFFKRYQPFFEQIYLAQQWRTLSALNQQLIKHISRDLLGIQTVFEDSRSYNLQGHRLERLLDLIVQSGATHYVSGPAGKNYIDENRFAENGIQLEWKDYTGYPVYAQGDLPFEHGVSILDLLFNTGPEAPAYIWGWRGGKEQA